MSALHKCCFLLPVIFVITAAPAARNSPPFAGRRVEHQTDRERLRELKRVVDEEVGVPRADDLTRCRLIAFGAKPCGGPWRYLVYSTGRTDEPKLKRLVAEYNALEKKINAEERLSSDCDREPEPKLALEDGVCAARRE